MRPCNGASVWLSALRLLYIDMPLASIEAVCKHDSKFSLENDEYADH